MTETDDLLERLEDEADLCRNDGADDCARLFDEAIKAINVLHAENAALLAANRDARVHFDTLKKDFDKLRVENNELRVTLKWLDTWLRAGR